MEKQAKTPFALIKDHVLLPQASKLEEADLFSKQLLSEEKIRQIIDLIPEEWLNWEGYDENMQEIKETYTQFLLVRLENSETFLKEAQNARKALI